MSLLTCTVTGKSINLLSEIADSGEAKVWRTNLKGYLAKIYHSPTLERVQKLAVMISHPPQEPNSHLNHISFAWPKSVLKDSNGNYVGFLMPEVQGARQLIDIYNPQRCHKLKLGINWRFLHVTALNIASFIAALHDADYVLGDIKPQNILVNNRALPSIIDTDSFQVKNPENGNVYHCLVGSEGYTPPELLGQDIASVTQTEIHDRFRLAIIIYHLLFGGNSPFQGKWIGSGETPEINELIRRGIWLYSENSLIQPVDRTIPLEIVHPEIKRCFLKCLNEGHFHPDVRPTAKEWMQALKVASHELNQCATVDSHYYSRSYGKCYWCDRSVKLKVDIFGVDKPQEKPHPPTKTLEEILTISGHSNSINSIVYSPDNQIIASAGRDKVIKLWNGSTGELITTFTGHGDWVHALAYSPDGKIIVSGSRDKTIKVWNVSTGREVHILTGHNNSVFALAFSSDANTLASGSADKTVKLWNVSTGKTIITLKEHSDSVLCLAYSPDGKILASGSADKTIKLWDVSTGKVIFTLFGHENWVRSLAYSPDGKTLASGSSDQTIKIWNVCTGRVIFTLTGHTDSVPSLAYNPNGKILASGSGDKTIKLWNVAIGREIGTLRGHLNSIRALVFNSDGQVLASGSADKNIKIWPLSSKKVISSSPITRSQPVRPAVSKTRKSSVHSYTKNSTKKSNFKTQFSAKNKQINQSLLSIIILLLLLAMSYFITIFNSNAPNQNLPNQEIPDAMNL